MPHRPSRTSSVIIVASLVSGGIINLLFFFFNFNNCRSPGNQSYQYSDTYNITGPNKPVLLLWFWPEDYKFSLSDCKTLLGIDGCLLTDDRSLYGAADSVLLFHKAIKSDLSNLPGSRRPRYQRWIWFHVESPTNTVRTPGLEKLFNLTLSYRRDADIVVHPQLKIRKHPSEGFAVPKKDKLVCWIVSNRDPNTGTSTRNDYYHHLKKHIHVHVYGTAFGTFLDHTEYYSTIASCKFYLAFENSIHWDYMTEKLNGPLVVGTIPVVLGPPRANYEHYVPGSSFIHVDDFADAEGLAKFLLELDKNETLYRGYFHWRKHLYAEPHLIMRHQEFVQHICTACQYVAQYKDYKTTADIYEWFFSKDDQSRP